MDDDLHFQHGGRYRFFPNSEERWEPLKRLHAVDPELSRGMIRRELAEGDVRDVELIGLRNQQRT